MSEIATFWDGNHPLASAAEKLFNQLVPFDGNAPTLQGELLRASTKISYDWYNNGWGCNNWSGAVIFLQRFFRELPNQLDGTLVAKLAKELSYVYEYSHGEPSPHNEDRADLAVTTIHEIVVQAILQNPDPIANTRDMYDFSERDYEHRWGDADEGDDDRYY